MPPSSMGTPKSSEMDRKTVEMHSLVRRVHISACFGEKRMSDSTCQRWKRPSRLLPTKSAKTSLCDGMGVHQCPLAWVICIYVKVPLMWRLMLEFWRDICCCQEDDFSQELHVYFSRTMPGLILHELQQRGFVGIECVCLTGLPAVQICLLLKNVWRIMKRKNQTRRPQTVEQLKSCIHQWAKIPLPKLQQLISSVPKWLQSVIKRKGDVTQW